MESQRFGGQVQDHFWKQLETCDERLKENSQSKPLITQSYKLTFVCHSRKSEGGGFCVGAEVFRGVVTRIRSQNVNSKPVLEMAVEILVSHVSKTAQSLLDV